MTEYIDKKEVNKVLTQIAVTVGKSINAVEIAHAVDAVPVIRCRDCKHRGTNSCPMHINGQPADEAFLRTVDDDYCSYGERSDGETVLGV